MATKMIDGESYEGVVERWDDGRGFGFVGTVFVHRHDCLDSAPRSGDRVRFTYTTTPKGGRGRDVEIVRKFEEVARV